MHLWRPLFARVAVDAVGGAPGWALPLAPVGGLVLLGRWLYRTARAIWQIVTRV